MQADARRLGIRLIVVEMRSTKNISALADDCGSPSSRQIKLIARALSDPRRQEILACIGSKTEP